MHCELLPQAHSHESFRGSGFVAGHVGQTRSYRTVHTRFGLGRVKESLQEPEKLDGNAYPLRCDGIQWSGGDLRGVVL